MTPTSADRSQRKADSHIIMEKTPLIRPTTRHSKAAKPSTSTPRQSFDFASEDLIPPKDRADDEGQLASVKALPALLTTELTGLAKRDLDVLQSKQALLRDLRRSMPAEASHIARAIEATLIFGQEEAGTAVCIAPQGLLLTCSHCIAESPEELDTTAGKWLLFASGQIARAYCIAWDPIKDLALMQITGVQHSPSSMEMSSILPEMASSRTARTSTFSFPFVHTAKAPLRGRSALVCIGQPGSEDLEVDRAGVKTDYDVLHVSHGNFRGYAPGQDLQDNSEIGALKHDCWTYWGHSGAPLVERRTGCLVGLHSSWDETTLMRRGIAPEAIQEFLELHVSIDEFPSCR